MFSVTTIIVRNQIYAGKYVTKLISSFGCRQIIASIGCIIISASKVTQVPAITVVACIIVGCSQICASIGCSINFCIQSVYGSRNYCLFILSLTTEPGCCFFVWILRLCLMISSQQWSHWIIALLWDSLISNISRPDGWLCWWWQPLCLQT